MPSPDVALKEFFRDNEIFAALFNGYFFNNDMVIKPDELKPANTAYSETLRVNSITNNTNHFSLSKINRYRDNLRICSNSLFVILGIEDQSIIHYSMPLRNNLYDLLGYCSELTNYSSINDKNNWTLDERLSNVKKDTKVTPIITVVFYTGEKPWDGPRSLHDMMNINDKIKNLVPNYPLYIVDIGHDKDLSFNNKSLNDLCHLLSSIYSNEADNDDTIIDNSIIALSGILANDSTLYHTAIGSKGGSKSMCKVLEERDEKIRKEKDAEFEIQKAAFLSELKAKEARIKELEMQLASLNTK